MSALVTQLYLLEKYGPRLTTEQLAEVLTSDAGTILNQVSAGTHCSDAACRPSPPRPVSAARAAS